ncbi:MAG: hypothetical protein COB38_08640 [Gammaproteobacteria bacterium]|nr:MAG: hypothetical protein COB38_08640 [Gammaproteobacteria bacterium]
MILVMIESNSLSDLELTGWLALIVFLVIAGEYIYRLAKRNCGRYTISSKQIVYKIRHKEWSEKLNQYESFNWYEGVFGSVHHGQQIEWFFILKHSSKSECSIIFNSKMMRGISKEESYLKWLELKGSLDIPAKEIFGKGVSIANISQKNYSEEQAKIKMEVPNKLKSTEDMNMVLKRNILSKIGMSFFTLMLFIIIERLFSSGDIYELSEGEITLTIWSTIFWFYCWYWALTTFRFYIEGSNLVIKTCIVGLLFGKKNIPFSQLVSVSTQSNSVGTSNLHILKKDGKKVSCNSIKTHQANRVKQWLMEINS